MRKPIRRISSWAGGSTNPANVRSGRDPINPLRIQRLRNRGLSYREIGIVIASEDGRKVPYTRDGVFHALKEYHRGIRDEDGERHDFVPATNRRPHPISLGPGIGVILFPALSG